MNTKALPVVPTSIEGLVNERFECGTPRSRPYQEGFRRGIAAQIARINHLTPIDTKNPYFNDSASADADAWWAGFDDAKVYHAVATRRWDEAMAEKVS